MTILQLLRFTYNKIKTIEKMSRRHFINTKSFFSNANFSDILRKLIKES